MPKIWLTNKMKNIPWLFLAFLVFLAPGLVEAQQTGARPYYVETGAYHIGVLSNPSSLSLGTIDYIVTLNDPQTAEPISDAIVRIRAIKAEDNGQEGWATALNTPNSPDLYTARVELDEPGVWKMGIEITSDLGHVQIEAPSQVVPVPRKSRDGGLVFLGAFAAIGMGALYAVWAIRRSQKRREAAIGS